MRLGDLNNVFYRIVTAAQKPHLGIPKVEANRKYKIYSHLLNRPIMSISVGAAAVVAGLTASHVYLTRKVTTS
ncbi:hypothetical protein ACHQM5_018357 [Ranunculus cassubicifolius]